MLLASDHRPSQASRELALGVDTVTQMMTTMMMTNNLLRRCTLKGLVKEQSQFNRVNIVNTVLHKKPVLLFSRPMSQDNGRAYYINGMDHSITFDDCRPALQAIRTDKIL